MIAQSTRIYFRKGNLEFNRLLKYMAMANELAAWAEK
jgi:hypothetical protein